MTAIGQDILFAAECLKKGELVAIPTETVYGLAGNGLHEESILKIYAAKNRPAFNPLILHIPSKQSLTKYASVVPKKARQLAEAFWPGPLTLVLAKKTAVPDIVTAGHSTVALRVPNHPLTLELLNQLDFPLAAPSANPSGYISPTKAEHVKEQLGDKVAYILDGGICNIGVESTIVKVDGDKVTLLRQGGITEEQLEAIIGPLLYPGIKSTAPEAPGMLSSHYAPKAKVVIGNINKLIQLHVGKRIGILSFTKSYAEVPADQQLALSPKGNLNEAARNIFSYLRQLDEMPLDLILTESVPNEGIGRAVNDRLKRAAAER